MKSLCRKTLAPICVHAVLTCLLGVGDVNGAEITQTMTMPSPKTWNDTNYWSNGQVPSAGNTYLNTVGGTRTAAGAFGGDSLELRAAGAALLLKSSPVTVDLIMNAGSRILNYGGGYTVNGTIISTNTLGSGTILFSSGADNRDINVLAPMTLGPEITTINVSMGPNDVSPLSEALIINNAANSYSGTWNVARGELRGTAGLGASSFVVQSNGLLNFNYDFTNLAGDLTIETGGKILLDQNLHFGSATLYGEELRAGTVWSGAQLKAHPIYGGAFDAASSDTATIAVAYPTGSRMEEVLAEFTFESAGSPASSDKSTYSTVTDWDLTYSDRDGGSDLAVIQNTTFSPDWVSVQKANQTPPSAFDAYQAFTVTITGLAGGAVDLTSFSYRHSAAGYALGFNSKVFSSLTGFGNSDGLGGLPGTDGNFDTLVNIDLTGNAAFSRLIDGTVVEFRIALRDGSGSGTRYHGLDDIVLTADVPMRGSIFGIY